MPSSHQKPYHKGSLTDTCSQQKLFFLEGEKNVSSPKKGKHKFMTRRVFFLQINLDAPKQKTLAINSRNEKSLENFLEHKFALFYKSLRVSKSRKISFSTEIYGTLRDFTCIIQLFRSRLKRLTKLQALFWK